ncbi:MAG: nuclear transport factor 2 family protein [Betaproteobacteria bacterium]
MFANGPINVHPEKLRTVNTGHCAVHNLMERVDISTDEGPNTAWVIATNVYIKTDQGWRLVAHHASPGSPRELQEVTEAPSVLH